MILCRDTKIECDHVIICTKPMREIYKLEDKHYTMHFQKAKYVLLDKDIFKYFQHLSLFYIYILRYMYICAITKEKLRNLVDNTKCLRIFLSFGRYLRLHAYTYVHALY